jgi:cold shock CspA family protein
MNGTISNLIVAKRFGFIAGTNGQEYFFHMSDLSDVNDWDVLVDAFAQHGGGTVKVDFEPLKTPKGPRAKDVSISA